MSWIRARLLYPLFQMAESTYTDQVWRRTQERFSGGRAGHHHPIMHRNEPGLNEVRLEVELLEYRSLPGADPSGPPDFFRGETSKWEAIPDLDRFFDRIYQYYCDKGFWCIVTKWIVELITLGFTICFSGFLLLFINWGGLLGAKCGVDGIEKTGKDCNLYEEALWPHPLKPFSFTTAVVVVYLIIFSVYWFFCFLRFFTQLRETLEIRDFCHNSLVVSEHELRTMQWPTLVDKVVEVQRRQRLCIIKELTAHDIVSRIMRKDNYMIGLLNKGVIALEIPRWLPGVGPAIMKDGVEKRILLTKTMEWTLNWCILQDMFDSNFTIRRDFTSNPDRLRKRFRTVGFCMLLLSPFLIIFMLLYFFLRYAEQFYHQPSAAGSRRWSNLSRWSFREFNELDHMFKRRLNASYKFAVEYAKQFPTPILSMVAKLVAFIIGGFGAVLLVIAVIDDSLLNAHLFEHSLLWYGAVFTVVTQVSRGLVTEEFQIFDPEGVMRQIAYHTHYMPKHWRGAENTDRVKKEFEGLFQSLQYKGVLFFEEMVSIFVTPFILWFYLPKCVDEVLQFVRDFTTTIDGIGSVCSLSVFDFENHGNSKYGSPFHTSKDRRSSQGKMEKSFISFKSNYPNWEPDGNGKQLLSVLADFRTRKDDVVNSTGARGNSAFDVRMQDVSRMGDSLYPRGGDSLSGDRFGHQVPSHPADEIQDRTQFRANYGDLSTLETDQIYLLDRFYSASQTAEPSVTSHASVDRRPNFESERQVGGNMQGSVSDSEIQDSAPRPRIVQQIPGQGGESRWWARRGPGSTMVPESTFEPPMFSGVAMLASQDDSYESEEDNERSWMNRRHSGDAYRSQQLSDDEASHFDLPFGDAFDKPRGPSVANERPTSSNSRN